MVGAVFLAGMAVLATMLLRRVETSDESGESAEPGHAVLASTSLAGTEPQVGD